MELDALDRQLAVADAHDLAVVAARGDLELVGHRRRGERVVAADLESLRQSLKDAASVVLDHARLAVQQALRAADLAAERLDDRLMTQADAERRHARVPHEADQLLGRPAGAGREDQVRRLELRVELVRPLHGDFGPELAQVVREVVRERVVVVDEQDHRCSCSASSIAASRAASLFRPSWCSSAGSESATIPPPAWSSASPSTSTSVRIAMHVSMNPPGSA